MTALKTSITYDLNIDGLRVAAYFIRSCASIYSCVLFSRLSDCENTSPKNQERAYLSG